MPVFESDVMLAIYQRSLADTEGLSAFEILDRVADLGLNGCMFQSPFELSPTLDQAELRAVHDYAAGRGISIEVTIGQINPYHFDTRPDLLALGDGDPRAALETLIDVAARFGWTTLMFTIGTLADRASRAVPWPEQLRASVAFLSGLAPVLRDNGISFCLKTHEEISSFEVVRMVDQVGADVLGVCYDPVNSLVRVEDPLAAAGRLQPYIRQIHVDDALIRLSEDGFERWLCPVGEGIVDWPAILSLLGTASQTRLTIELHRAFFITPIFDSAWYAAQPDLTASELATVLRLAQASAARPLVESFQSNPITRLAPTLQWLREYGQQR